MAEYELSLKIGRIKEEHVQYCVNMMDTVSRLFMLDGADRSIDLSLENDRNGVEMIYNFLQTED